MEAGPGVVELAVGGQGLDQVVLALVGRDLAHEEQIGTAPCLLLGQSGGERGVRRPREALQVDEEGDGGGRPVAGGSELTLVELGVGDGELGDRGQVPQLGPTPADLLPHLRHPRLEQVGRRDVVVVDELALAPLTEDVGHAAADGELVEEHPAVGRVVTQAADRIAEVEPVGRGVAVVDVRLVAPGPQQVAQLHRVATDGIPTGQRGDDLVDAVDASAGHRPITRPTLPSRPGARTGHRHCRDLAGEPGGPEPEAHVERQPHPTGGPTVVGHLELGHLVLPVVDGGVGGAADADTDRVGPVQQRAPRGRGTGRCLLRRGSPWRTPGSSGSEAKTSSFSSSWMAMVAMALGTAARLSMSAVMVRDSPG